MSDQIPIEAQLYEKWAAALLNLVSLRKEFERAGVSAPQRLLNILGEGDTTTTETTITDVDEPPRPEIAKSDWIWVPLESLRPQTLALAIMREHNAPVRPKDLHEMVCKRRGDDISAGVIYNIGPRLEGSIIERDERGWTLIDSTKVPLLYRGAAWGPSDAFEKQEAAAYRRWHIVSLLEEWTNGLLVSQIVSQLKDRLPPGIPGQKDAVKADMAAMQAEGIVKRYGSKGKWTLTEAH